MLARDFERALEVLDGLVHFGTCYPNENAVAERRGHMLIIAVLLAGRDDAVEHPFGFLDASQAHAIGASQCQGDDERLVTILAHALGLRRRLLEELDGFLRLTP